MYPRSQKSNLQLECGLHWIIAALLILCAIGSAHAENGTNARAEMHIRVTVVPILQAQQSAQNMHPRADASPVTYHLQPAMLKVLKREVRDTLTATRLVGRPFVALETATTVIE